MVIAWCETHKLRVKDPEHKVEGHVCSIVEKEVYIAKGR